MGPRSDPRPFSYGGLRCRGAIGNLHACASRKHGRAASLALGLLGLGQITDPPKRAVIEAIEGRETPPAPTGEPKDATSGS
jgi:hypothetical protein